MFRAFFVCTSVCRVLAFFCFGAEIILPAVGAAQQAQPKSAEAVTEKARKTYAEAIDWEKHGNTETAIRMFLLASKQDEGRCGACLSRAFNLAFNIGDYKDAESALRDLLPLAKSDMERAALSLRLGMTLQREGLSKKKDSCFSESCDEFKVGLQQDPKLSALHYGMGVSLAHLRQDDAARAEFNTFLQEDKDNGELHERARRFAERIELARAKMAPGFEVTTIDGQHIAMDSLQGKVVLIDFWATWCGPCREALPHMRDVVKKFAGQHFVAISISLDSDESKWKTFVSKNDMTWPQARDGGFNGQMSRSFSVDEIPATFSIDADGVLEDQHVGDANIDGKLKKMIARASELAAHKQEPASTENKAGKPADAN